jgi:hypothetical protein
VDGVKFILEVDMDRLEGDAGKELGRILRYWGGAMTQVELAAGSTQALYDSGYREVGRWIITEEPQSAG